MMASPNVEDTRDGDYGESEDNVHDQLPSVEQTRLFAATILSDYERRNSVLCEIIVLLHSLSMGNTIKLMDNPSARASRRKCARALPFRLGVCHGNPACSRFERRVYARHGTSRTNRAIARTGNFASERFRVQVITSTQGGQLDCEYRSRRRGSCFIGGSLCNYFSS
jgi:hypothetical protein